MPTLSVFIRKGDVDKWKAVPNKSEFMHQALSSTNPLIWANTKKIADELIDKRDFKQIKKPEPDDDELKIREFP